MPQPRPVRPGPWPRRSPGLCVPEPLRGAAGRAHLRSPSLGTRPSAGAVPGDTRTRRSRDVTSGTALRGDAGRDRRDSAHAAPGSSRRRAPRPRPCVRRRGSGMRERAPGSPAKWGCAGASRGAPVPILPAGTHTSPAGVAATGSGAGVGATSPRSRFRVGSTRWTRLSNHRGRRCQRGDIRGHRCQPLAPRGTPCPVPAAARGDLCPCRGYGNEPLGTAAARGTRGAPAEPRAGGAARGAMPGAARGTLGRSRDGDGTSGPSRCAFVLPARSEERGGFRRGSSFGLRLSSLQMIIIVIT